MAADLGGAEALLAAARAERPGPHGQLADGVAARHPPRALARPGGAGGGARAAQSPRRPRRPAGVRLLAGVLGVALRPGPERRRRAGRLLRLRRRPRAHPPRPAARGDRGGGQAPKAGPSGRGLRGRRPALSEELALLEASWNQVGGEPAFGMVVYGDAGTLIVHQPRATREGQRVGPGRVEIVTDAGSEMVEPPPLPSEERDGPTYFLTCLRTGRPVEGLCAPDVRRCRRGRAHVGSARRRVAVVLPAGPAARARPVVRTRPSQPAPRRGGRRRGLPPSRSGDAAPGACALRARHPRIRSATRHLDPDVIARPPAGPRGWPAGAAQR